MGRYMRSIGFERWHNIVGLRADEPNRVARVDRRNCGARERYTAYCPLAVAGVTRAEVLAFWQAQPFDLAIPADRWGNCDFCFLKAKAKIDANAQEAPHRLEWWRRMEEEIGKTFWGRRRRPPTDRAAMAAPAMAGPDTPMRAG